MKEQTVYLDLQLLLKLTHWISHFRLIQSINQSIKSGEILRPFLIPIPALFMNTTWQNLQGKEQRHRAKLHFDSL